MTNAITAGEPVLLTATGSRQAVLIVALMTALLGACGKSEKTQTTAERLGSVKELQETQSDFYLPHKSVDYLTDIKTQKENAAKGIEAAPAKPLPEAKVVAAPAVPATPAPAPAPVAPAPVVAAAPAPAPQAAEPVREIVHVPPARVASSCKLPEYPATSVRLEETGAVALKFLVDINGNVLSSEVQTSSGHPRLDDAAKVAFSKCRFTPGTADGKAEQATATVRYVWKLN